MAVVNFVWDPLSDNVLKETDETNATTVNYTTAPNQFGETLSQHDQFGDTYMHYDGLGCTRNLTSSTETVVRTNTYTAFGENVSSSGLHNTVFGWNGAAGYYTDEESGDFYVRRRTYNPDTGRWRSRDPLGFIDGPNVYEYAGNQPISTIELFGMTNLRNSPSSVEAGRFNRANRFTIGNYRQFSRALSKVGIDPSGSCVCCCCPSSISLSDVDLVLMPQDGLPENESYGLRFRVIANLKRTTTRIESDANCKIEWYECSTRPGSLGQEANVWFHVPGTPPDDAITDWFDPPPDECPTTYQRFWEDSPLILNIAGYRTAMKFAVRVTGNPDCGCSPNSVTKLFRIDVRVTMDGGILDPPSIIPDPPVLLDGVDEGDPADCDSSNIPFENPW